MTTLQDICVQVRVLVGACRDDIPESTIEETVQNYWTVSFPALIKTDDRHGTYYFTTIKGVSTYPHPKNYFDLNPPALCEGYGMRVVYDPMALSSLDRYWYEQPLILKPTSESTYTTILRFSPYVESINVFSTDGTYSYDSKEISYDEASRELTAKLPSALHPDSELKVKYTYCEETRPSWILITPQKLVLYPSPDANYSIALAGIKRPEALPYQGTISIPEEYIELIVYGAALKLIAPIDLNYHHSLYPIYLQKKRLAMARTHHHLSYKLVQGI